MSEATWYLAAPAGNSYEPVTGGLLTVNYADNIDGRDGDRLTLGPLVTTVDLDDAYDAGGGTVGARATPVALEVTEGIDAAEKLLVGAGTKLPIIKLSTRANVADGSMTGAGAPFSGAVTDLLYTRSASGTEEVSIFFDAVVFQVLTAAPSTGGFTASANNESLIVRHAAIMGSDAAARVVGMVGRSGNGTSPMNTVRQNILAGSTTMDASASTVLATLSGSPVIFTGLALDGRMWLLGTSDGAYVLDANGRNFRPLLEEVANQATNPTNCYGIRRTAWFGTLIPLDRSTRYSLDGVGGSIGPETYPRNSGPVNGRVGRGDGSPLWDYWPIYNGTDTYICAVRPRQPHDLVTDDRSVVFYPIIKISGESKVVKFTGLKGGVSRPTLWCGHGQDVAYWVEGNTFRFADDSSYAYATTGSVYGTELRRDPQRLKRITKVKLSTRDCTSTETVAVDIVYRDANEAVQTVRVGQPLTKNGWRPLDPPAGGIVARSFYPVVTLARGGTATASPKVLDGGRVIVEYEDA